MRNRGVPMDNKPTGSPHPVRITATDDPVLAERLGLSEFDEERGQFVAPADAPGDPGEAADGASSGPEGGAGGDLGEEPVLKAYEGEEWTQGALREACKQRGISASGSNEELAERLRKYDEFPPGPKD